MESSFVNWRSKPSSTTTQSTYHQRTLQPPQPHVASDSAKETQRHHKEKAHDSYLIKDYMIEEIHTIDEKATAEDVVKVMTEDDRDQDYVIVLEKGKPIGIITTKDVVDALAKSIPLNVNVKDIMTSHLITIDPDQDLMIAGKVMRKNNLRHLPVMKTGIMYGIITAKVIVDRLVNYVNKSIRDIMLFSSFNSL